MNNTDIKALVERLRLAVQRLTIDISDAGMAADALEALQARAEKAEAALEKANA